MELDNTGNLLRGLFGKSDPSDMGQDMLNKDSSYPKSRTTVIGMRIDLYGDVLGFTREHDHGWRVFDSFANMYKDDGSGEESHHDLVEEDFDETSPKSMSCYIWVHPIHLQIASLFPIMERGRSKLMVGKSYLNRMGFVVTLEGAEGDPPKSMMRDNHGNLYYPTGRRYTDKMSMTDLTHEITDWQHFQKSDWSTAEVVTLNPTMTFSPESYDPGAQSQAEMRRRFYDALLEAHAISKQMGTTFSFVIDTKKQ